MAVATIKRISSENSKDWITIRILIPLRAISTTIHECLKVDLETSGEPKMAGQLPKIMAIQIIETRNGKMKGLNNLKNS